MGEFDFRSQSGRCRMIEALRDRKESVNEIASASGLGVAQVQRELVSLAERGKVTVVGIGRAHNGRAYNRWRLIDV